MCTPRPSYPPVADFTTSGRAVLRRELLDLSRARWSTTKGGSGNESALERASLGRLVGHREHSGPGSDRTRRVPRGRRRTSWSTSSSRRSPRRRRVGEGVEHAGFVGIADRHERIAAGHRGVGRLRRGRGPRGRAARRPGSSMRASWPPRRCRPEAGGLRGGPGTSPSVMVVAGSLLAEPYRWEGHDETVPCFGDGTYMVHRCDQHHPWTGS